MTGGHVTVNTELDMNPSPIELHHRTHCSNLPVLNTVSLALFHIVRRQMSTHSAVNVGRKCGLRSHHVTGQERKGMVKGHRPFLEQWFLIFLMLGPLI